MKHLDVLADAGLVTLSKSGRTVTVRLRPQPKFLEIDPLRRVVMSWRWKGGLEDPGESRIEITLRATPDGTDLSFTHSQLHDEASSRNHEQGWAGSLRKLGAYLAKDEALQGSR
jgi:uncharacterized protein YndB with AHSA1/START domain